MQQYFEEEQVHFLVGSKEILLKMLNQPPMKFASVHVRSFLTALSRELIVNREVRQHQDLIALAYWLDEISKKDSSSLVNDVDNKTGRGLALHIAPANVPLNFAYSLAVSLISGNSNIVRISTRQFTQVDICVRVMNAVLESTQHQEVRKQIVIIRYPRESILTSVISKECDLRIIWGGDETINAIRNVPIKGNSLDVVFPNKYSIAILNARYFLAEKQKETVFKKFYNDTLLSDQNACSSPSLLLWVGNKDEVAIAQSDFWNGFSVFAEQIYKMPISEVQTKLALSCQIASTGFVKDFRISDNRLLWRIEPNEQITDFSKIKGNCGFFYENYVPLIADAVKYFNSNVQTVSYYGFEIEYIKKVFQSIDFQGAERFVNLGATLNFSHIWDGQNLFSLFTKTRTFGDA